MTATHLHLLLNHLPILGVPFGLALLAYGSLRRQEQVQRVALLIFVLLGLAVWPVFLTGEPAEEGVENLPQVSETVIEPHEDAAKLALISTEVLALASLGALVLYRRKPLSAYATVPVMGVALVATLALGWTGWLGGQIRHTEIRSGVPAASHETRAEHE